MYEQLSTTRVPPSVCGLTLLWSRMSSTSYSSSLGGASLAGGVSWLLALFALFLLAWDLLRDLLLGWELG